MKEYENFYSLLGTLAVTLEELTELVHNTPLATLLLWLDGVEWEPDEVTVTLDNFEEALREWIITMEPPA